MPFYVPDFRDCKPMINARVETVAFLGDHYQYMLRAGDLVLIAQTSQPVPDEHVKVHIPADACAIVA